MIGSAWLRMRKQIRAFNQHATNKLVAKTAVSGVLVQVGRPLASLITVPFLLAQLGQAGLGVWLIALSFMALIGVLNTGLSISLVTHVSRRGNEEAHADISPLATAGAIIAFATAICVFALVFPAIWLINWSALLDLEGAVSTAEFRAMLTVLVAVMVTGFLAAVPRQVMMGRLHGYIAHALDLLGIGLGSAALIIAIFADQPLWVLALCFIAPSPLVLLLGGLIYLRNAGISMFAFRRVDMSQLFALGKDSLRMVGYHAAYSVSSQSDLFLIGAMVGASASAVYGVAQRVFSLPMMFAQAINQAQWPSLARLDAAGDHLQFAKSLRQTFVILVTMCALISLGVAFIYADVTALWLGEVLATDNALLAGMVVWVPLAVAVSIFDTALRAQNATGYLAKSMMRMAVINIVSSVALIYYMGYAGALWGTITGYILALLIPYAVRYHNSRSADGIRSSAQ